LVVDSAPSVWGLRLQANAAPTFRADGPLVEQFNASAFKRRNNFREAVDNASDSAGARLHPLDRLHGNPGKPGQLFLIDTQQGTRGAHLGASYHLYNPKPD
jgi:hypothetical protein